MRYITARCSLAVRSSSGFASRALTSAGVRRNLRFQFLPPGTRPECESRGAEPAALALVADCDDAPFAAPPPLAPAALFTTDKASDSSPETTAPTAAGATTLAMSIHTREH